MMFAEWTSEQITTIVVSVCGVIAALAAAYQSRQARNISGEAKTAAVEAKTAAVEAKGASEDNGTKIVEVHRELNGKLAALVEAKEAAAHAVGVVAGRAEESDRAAAGAQAEEALRQIAREEVAKLLSTARDEAGR